MARAIQNPPSGGFDKLEEPAKQAEQLAGEHLAVEGVVASLVRESIQNSLDAVQPGSSARVEFSLGTVGRAAAAPFLEGLGEHLEAAALPARVEGRFLLIEDFGTRGLEGDPERWSEKLADGSPNHFFRFWHRIGNNGDAKRLGSWGVGRAVFANSSKVRSFFGLSRAGDGREARLMGEASLRTHVIGDDTYQWYGHFGRFVAKARGRSPRPVTDPSFVDLFQRAFGLRRGAGQTGLSVVIPFPRSEIDREKLAITAAEEYFLPILQGRLVVIVREAERRIELNATTLEAEVERLNGIEKGRRDALCALARLVRQHHLALNDADRCEVPLDPARPYELGLATLPPEAREGLAERWRSGRPVAFRVRVPVRADKQQPFDPEQRETVRILLARDDSAGTRGDVPHVRSGLSISRLRHPGVAGVRGLMVVGGGEEKGALERVLQDLEGPAHVNWTLQGGGFDKAKQGCEEAHQVILFARSIVGRLVKLLSVADERPDFALLADLFPTPGEEADGPRRPPRPTGPQPPPPPPPPPPVPASFLKRAVPPDGVEIKSNPAYRGSPRTLRIEFAYAAFGRRPGWDERDFNLERLPKVITGADCTVRENELRIVPGAGPFSVKVSGFDPRRALVVSVRSVRPKSSQDDEQGDQ